ncbi:MAG: TonB family protein [Desulfuromusa sp.]|nr:TonB family protein [Desulfuromusa sp.]
MNPATSTRQKPTNDRPRLLILSLLLSLGLHLLVVLPLLQQQDKPQLWQQQPTIVHLVDMPAIIKKLQQEKPTEFEIDQQPVRPKPKTPVESFRKADQDQRVDQEQAPKGEDVRDQTTKPPIAMLTPKQKQKPQDKSVQKQPQKNNQKKSRPVKEKTFKPAAQKPAPTIISQPEQPKALPPILSPEQLRPDFSTLDQIARGSQGSRNRVKERKDVEIGDTVWLNLQHNLLISFFRRFHDQIELVWNYPTKAAVKGIEGTLELLIIVNPKGELIDVDLLQTSGSDLLDFEAIQAVYRAAPFGPLTKHYPHEKLKIRAYFSYQLSGRYIYGR